MPRHPLFRVFLLLATAPLVAFALYFGGLAREQLDQDWKRVELTYSFDLRPGVDEGEALDRARKVLEARLEDLRAARVRSAVEPGRRIRLEFMIPVPAASKEADQKKMGAGVLEHARSVLEQVGDVEFLACAEPEDVERLGGNLEQERALVDRWRREHGGHPVPEFDSTPREAGGPLPGLLWLPKRSPAGAEEKASTLMPLLDPDPKWTFTEADLESVSPAPDGLGYPAIHFELPDARRKPFGDFTESLIDRQLAIVVSGRVVTAPKVKSRLPGSGIIEGGATGFQPEEVRDLIGLLRAGRLPSKPVHVSWKESQPVPFRLRSVVYFGLATSASLGALVLLFALGLSFRRPTPSPESDWSDRAQPGSP